MMLRNPWKPVPDMMTDNRPAVEEMKVDYADVEHDKEAGPIAVLEAMLCTVFFAECGNIGNIVSGSSGTISPMPGAQ